MAGTRIALCCDVEASRPTAFVRCLALAEELVSRNIGVVFVADVADVPWAQAQLSARGLTAEPPPADTAGHRRLLDRLGVDAVVLDAREPDETLAAVRATGRTTLVVADGHDDVEADIVVDPRLDAPDRRPPAGSTLLTGQEYVLLRNDALANRPISVPRRRAGDPPAVLVALGDATARGHEAVALLLVEAGVPFDASFVTSDDEVGERVAAVRTAPGQRLKVLAPGPRLHEHAARSDVVVSTSGYSAYEWLAVGSALGLVWDTEDEVELYRRLMVRRAVVGLGSLADLADDVTPAAEKAQRLLLDAAGRARLAEVAWRLVDGLGRVRVVDALLDHLR